MTLTPFFNKIRSAFTPQILPAFLTLLWCMVFSDRFLSAADAPPNVVLIVIDDLGWADLGSYGSKFHKSPHLDRLASEGIRFTQAYAAAPVGSPTRAAILTGRYPQRMGITTSVLGATDDPNRRLKSPEVAPQLPLSEVTMARMLKSRGYATGSIGKWNLGGAGFGPREHGFDVDIAGIDVVADTYSEFAPYTNKAGATLRGLEQSPAGEFLTDRLAAEAEKFIADHRSQPFFLYLPHFTVHMPATVRPEIAAKYGKMPTVPNGTQNNPDFAAMIESMDQAVGRVLKALDQHQLTENTLVLFTSDNGGACNGNGQIIASTTNAPLRDGMGHLYEGGIRVPLMIKWPGHIQAGSTNDEVVSCLDFLPTIAEACAVPAATRTAGPAVDGQSLLPLFNGTGKITRDALYWYFPHYNVNAGSVPGAAVRAGDWKLIEFLNTGRRELFNLKDSLSESSNLIEQHANVAKDLGTKLDQWRESLGIKPLAPNPGYAPNLQSDDGSVLMPASSADVFGITLRYEPLPHKDTLGFWVRQEDWASFEFTLKRPGRFNLVPHVGCGTNGGSLVHFDVADQTLPLTVPGTGHFQNFVPQDLGIVTFDKPGRYTLTVKPQRKEGVAVMDIRRIELKPVTPEKMLSELHLLDPFWRSTTVYRESVLFVQEGTDPLAKGKLLFPAQRILAVHSANGKESFTENVDFHLSPDRRQLIRVAKSAIPFLQGSDLFMPKGTRPVWMGGPQPAVPCALPHKAGDPETHLLFDNGHWFHDQQIEVTYLRESGAWPSATPKFDPQRLPKTLARLKAKQKLTIGLSGDSISYGLNASGLVIAPPYMPIYPELVAGQLRAHYGGEIQLFNRAVGGWGVPNGLADLDQLLRHQPDLVVIAYGMNDVGRRNPEAYQSGILELITRTRKARPDTEIILVATMLGNDQWTHTPREMFPRYRQALESLCGEGVALADLTSLWTEMLQRKRDCDLTGNGVNHPSDFGHRVYASAILSLLVDQ
jgi:arylsulfatase A-like enzyme/lysophospholipase L1-like esterase